MLFSLVYCAPPASAVTTAGSSKHSTGLSTCAENVGVCVHAEKSCIQCLCSSVNGCRAVYTVLRSQEACKWERGPGQRGSGFVISGWQDLSGHALKGVFWLPLWQHVETRICRARCMAL